MNRLAWLTATATVATVAVLALADGVVEIIAFELIVAALVTVGFLAVGPLRPARILERAPVTAALGTSNHPPQLQRLEWMVEFATTASADAELRLIPELRQLAAERLQARHSIDLYTDRDHAAALLGPEVWPYIDPQRPRTFGRSAMSPQEVGVIVSAIEEL